MPLPPVPKYHTGCHPDAVVRVEYIRFTVLTERIIRIEYDKENGFENRPSQMFPYRHQPPPRFKKEVDDSWVEIETDYLHLKYHITPLGLTPLTLSIKLKQSNTTWYYGKPQSRNLKGTARTLDRSFGRIRLDDGIISKSGWVVLDDSNSLVFNESGWLEPRTRKQKDIYFFGYDRDIDSCLNDFTRISGRIPMIPRFILGNWWSHFWAYTQQELQNLIEEFRSHQVPLSVCIVDMDWHITKTGNNSSGWTGFTWNRDLFPNPSAFISWVHQQGLRIALNLHPADGIHPHEEQYKKMARWMNVDPDSKNPIPFDITDPRFMEGYFDILLHPYEKDGIDFWWTDWQQGKRSSIPGLDPLWWLNHLHFHDLGRDGKKRPFIFSRWGGLGNHRYPIGFSGDTFIRWSALAFQPYFTATAANVAYGWWSHDIGGHMVKDLSPELFLRWIQFGVFSPILRLHSTKNEGADRRPWSKPGKYFKAARAAMQLRLSLIPYIYSMAWRAHRTGISLVTPIYYGNMDYPDAFKAKGQYFFGTELMVAPITEPIDPKTNLVNKWIWFPPGNWFNFFNGDAMAGGRWYKLNYSLEQIPVFAKEGGIIPMGTGINWGGIDNPEQLNVHVFPGADNVFELYEDDGETNDYLKGRYAVTRFTLSREKLIIQLPEKNLDLIPTVRSFHIHIHGTETRSGFISSNHSHPIQKILPIESVPMTPGNKIPVEF